ncbi:radical SAM protein, partial [candidate division CSSED10-310 bacterium]
MAKLKQKLALMKGLLSGDIAYNSPFYVTIDVTRRCNLSCLCCRCHSPLITVPTPGDHTIQDISVEFFARVCHELKQSGTELIILESEGEPFLHPQLFELITIAKRQGLRVILFTNGTLLAEHNIQQLIELRLDTLMVSLWALTRADYEKTHPGTDPLLFDQIIHHLQQLAELKRKQQIPFPRVEVCLPLNKYNFKQIDSTVEVAAKSNCNELHFTKLDTIRDNFAKFSLSADDERFLRSAFTEIGRKLKVLGVSHNIKNIIRQYRVEESAWRR